MNVRVIPVRSAVMRWIVVAALLLTWSAFQITPQVDAADWRFTVEYPKSLRAEPFTGRVYILFTKDQKKEPRFGPAWFATEPFLSLDVVNWQPDSPLTIDTRTAGVLSYPKPLAELPLTNLRAQVVARFNPWERDAGTGAGNGVSDVATIADESPRAFTVNRLLPAAKPADTEWAKVLDVPSKLLSAFHHRDVSQRALVLLPASYHEQPTRKYPVIYMIPGFGGSPFGRIPNQRPMPSKPGEVEFLRVILDANCSLGHHVFADSENNGPCGQALVQELIPAVEAQFRAVAAPTARYLTGHSSGGWSSLWVQISHPTVFGGTWSTAPDPVDFRDFQRINLYKPGENMYRDAEGMPRPLARNEGRGAIGYEDFANMERVLGHGGQLYSFEAVFSPRGADGRPRLLWDRNTGAIDPEVARAWEKYDIRLVLERNWNTLGPQLAGKLHIIMGDADTFYLEGATKLLKQSLEQLGSDAVVELVPGRNHGNLLDPATLQRILREMSDVFRKHHAAELPAPEK